MPPAECMEAITELRKEIAALKATDAEGIWCDEVTLRVEALENRLTAIESTLEAVPGIVAAYDERLRKLEAAVQMPIYLHKRNMITGEETTDEVRLGEGFTFKLYPHQN